MNINFSVEAIVSLLAEVWTIHKMNCFQSYWFETSGRLIEDQVSFDCIYIAEAESGDIPHAVLRSATRWWQVDDQGVKAIGRPDLSKFSGLPETMRCECFISPFISFFVEENDILIKENYGPRLLAWKSGKLILKDKNVFINEIKTVRTYDSITNYK
jgi:hypothetical protein